MLQAEPNRPLLKAKMPVEKWPEKAVLMKFSTGTGLSERKQGTIRVICWQSTHLFSFSALELEGNGIQKYRLIPMVTEISRQGSIQAVLW